LALEALAGGFPLTHLDERTRTRVQQEAERRLNMISVTERQIDRLCNSNLWDYMPHALSYVCNRALQIYSGGASRRHVMVRIVGETGQPAGEPIHLIRSGDEYNCAHYDLVSSSHAHGAPCCRSCAGLTASRPMQVVRRAEQPGGNDADQARTSAG
jgi:hypothetical protein